MSAEEWRPVLGSNGRYEVSDQGRVRSTSLVRYGPTMLRTHPSNGGYRCVQLSLTPGTGTNLRVHRLVLEAFNGHPRPAGLVTRHLNGDPADNRLVNLVWGTNLENADDIRQHGTHNNGRKTHCKRGHEFTEANTFRDRAGKRECRACRREYFAARDARKRAERAA